MNLQLSAGLAPNPRTWPLFHGLVKPDAIDLILSAVHPSELFWRQLRFGDFDLSDMSFSSLTIALARGDRRWVGLPIFTTRRFFHTGILVRRDAGIETPADLKGKRVGVPEYQQTAALWTRGVLQHEFGVAPGDMEFWMERNPERSHGGATDFTPPPGVTIHRIPPGKDIGSMMLSGELQATLLYIVNRNLVDRSSADLWNHPDIKYLFPDPKAEGVRFYKKTGLYPINHCVVMKREIVERHRWAVLNVYKAFERANAIANEQRMEHVACYIETGLVPPDAGKALALPLIQYGIAANRRVLETALQYSVEQGLTPRLMKIEEIFAESTLDQ
ncbi:MAG TPA: ABC transporter substrate-binding protein [Candidatus Acidoferrales bacterium]|nr:ABC transporter substrate-binding protein [Candidatus Acidoferrales bacterium]